MIFPGIWIPSVAAPNDAVLQISVRFAVREATTQRALRAFCEPVWIPPFIGEKESATPDCESMKFLSACMLCDDLKTIPEGLSGTARCSLNSSCSLFETENPRIDRKPFFAAPRSGGIQISGEGSLIFTPQIRFAASPCAGTPAPCLELDRPCEVRRFVVKVRVQAAHDACSSAMRIR